MLSTGNMTVCSVIPAYGWLALCSRRVFCQILHLVDIKLVLVQQCAPRHPFCYATSRPPTRQALRLSIFCISSLILMEAFPRLAPFLHAPARKTNSPKHRPPCSPTFRKQNEHSSRSTRARTHAKACVRRETLVLDLLHTIHHLYRCGHCCCQDGRRLDGISRVGLCRLVTGRGKRRMRGSGLKGGAKAPKVRPRRR